MSGNNVRPERSGWRDERISRIHREWGFNLPITDLDFVVAEYDSLEPRALIEYKHENAVPCPGDDPGRTVLKKMADRLELPFFGVRYADDFSWFIVTRGNLIAFRLVEQQTRMSHIEFVSFLYRIRGRKPPDNISDLVSNAISTMLAKPSCV